VRARIIQVLNEALKLDPDGIQELLQLRVKTTSFMSTHPTIVTDPEENEISVLGLIQGLISDPRALLRPVCEDGVLKGFR
jgi:hypothetical protein